MPLKNAKAKGARRERQCIKLLEAEGYRCMKAGGSLGEWDVIGINDDSTVLVQVKSNRWPSRAEVTRLTDFPCHVRCVKEIWRFDDGGGLRIKFYINGTWVEANPPKGELE